MLRQAGRDAQVVLEQRRVEVADEDATVEQCPVHVAGGDAVQAAEDEVRGGRRDFDAGQGREQAFEPLALRDDRGDALLQVAEVVEAGECGDFRRDVEVIRLLHAQDEVDQGRPGDHVADAQPGEARPLAQGPQDDQVLVLGDQVDAGLSGELRVRLVDGDGLAGGEEGQQVSPLKGA